MVNQKKKKKSWLSYRWQRVFVLDPTPSVCRFSNQAESSPITNESTPPRPCVSASPSVLRGIKDRRNNPSREIKKEKVQKRQEARETNVQSLENGRMCHKGAKKKKKRKSLVP